MRNDAPSLNSLDEPARHYYMVASAEAQLERVYPACGRTALERAGLRTRDPIGAPSLLSSALRSHLVRHRCGKDLCGCNDICESVNRLNHRTGDPAQISPAEAFDLSIDSSCRPFSGAGSHEVREQEHNKRNLSTMNQSTNQSTIHSPLHRRLR